MTAVASTDQRFEFVRQLARDLASGGVNLPSFPAVIIKIREMLEDDDCDFEKLTEVINADAALVSRLFVFANSAYHNRTGEAVDSLHSAISRLGLELVRNTALSMAIKQMVFSEKHRGLAEPLRRLWVRSLRLASMSHAVASLAPDVDRETAFMAGMLHEIGKLYILSKAKQFPEFLGDAESLQQVLDEWHPQIGRSIVEAWEFPEDIVRTMVPQEFIDEHIQKAPKLVDAIYLAELLFDKPEDSWLVIESTPVYRKFKLNEAGLDELRHRFNEKLEVVQQSLS